MIGRRLLAVAAVLLFLFACKSDRKSKNDDIAACSATGGRWVEGGCNDNGHCEKSNGMSADDDDDDLVDDDLVDSGDLVDGGPR